MTNAEVLTELGRRMRQRRLDMDMSVEKMAAAADLNKKTVLALESGNDTRFDSIIRVLRVLGMLGNLDALVPDTLPSMAAFRTPTKLRTRASRKSGKI